MPLGRGLYLEYIRRPHTGDLNAYLVFRDGGGGTRVIAGAPESFTGDESGGLEVDRQLQESRAAYGPSNLPRTRQAVRLPTGEQTPEAAWEALTEAAKDLRRRGLSEDVMGDNRRANRITRSLMDAAGIPWGRVVGANKLYHLPGFEGEGLKIEPEGRHNSLRPRTVSPGTELTEGLSAPRRSQTEVEGQLPDQRKAAISGSDLLHLASDAKGAEPTAGARKGRGNPTGPSGRAGGRASVAKDPYAVRNMDWGLEEIEESLRGKAYLFERAGYDYSAKFLRRFLDPNPKDPGDVELSREEARSFKPIGDAEQVNIRRFETESFLGTSKKTPHLPNIPDDGKSYQFKDHWKRNYDMWDVGEQYLFGDRDYALAFGRAGLHSEANFTAKRTGNVIELKGRVDHLWHDDYNFDPNLELLSDSVFHAYLLQEKGRATPFKIKSEWCQRFRGTVERKKIMEEQSDGSLKPKVILFNPRIEWEEIEECGEGDSPE